MATKQTAAVLKPTGAPKTGQTVAAGGAVAVVGGGAGAVALPADLVAEFAQAAKDAAALERPKISKISLKSGMMTYMQQPVPGDAIDVVVLAAAFRNTWYSGTYDPDNIVNPACFAIRIVKPGVDTVMLPHENVAEPVHATCDGCPKNQWGSAVRDGKPSKGKACKEGRRLLVMPRAALESAEAVSAAEVAVLDVPVTSVNNYATYINTLAATLARPSWSVITTVSLHRHVRNQFEVKFTPIEAIQDVDVLRAIKARLEEAERFVTTPYDETELVGKEEPAPPAKAPAKKKFAAA